MVWNFREDIFIADGLWNTIVLSLWHAEGADGMELQRNGRSDRKARQNVGYQHL